jgi:hypothetical protein
MVGEKAALGQEEHGVDHAKNRDVRPDAEG